MSERSIAEIIGGELRPDDGWMMPDGTWRNDEDDITPDDLLAWLTPRVGWWEIWPAPPPPRSKGVKFSSGHVETEAPTLRAALEAAVRAVDGAT